MSQLLTPETFEFFARYLLAGYVFLAVRSRWVAAERPKLNETLVEAVILSLVNQAVLLVSFAWADATWHAANASASILMQFVIQPAALGAIAGILVSWNRFPAGLRRLVMPTSRPVSQAYEFAFQANARPGYVIVAFHDGREVYGLFGENSLASEDLADGGIYLEHLYIAGEDGTWSEAEPPRSAWISLSGVRSIEFLREE